jgi:hypothetical protein
MLGDGSIGELLPRQAGNTAASAGRLCWENHGDGPTGAAQMKCGEVSVPVGG